MHVQTDEAGRRTTATTGTREALVRAFLKIVRTTRLMPDEFAVAELAGCPVSAIEHGFGDLAGLASEAFERLLTAAPEDFSGLGQAGRLARIHSHVSQRAAAWEWLLPYWRVLDAQETALPDLSQRLDAYRRRRGLALTALYAVDLKVLAPDRRPTTLLMIDLLTDLAAWGRLREHEGLSKARAESLWTWTIDRMLPGGAPDAASWHAIA